jgi:hypothetical protein
MLGTYIWTGDKNWQDYVVSFKLRSDDDDAVGVMFRYLNGDSYYRISMSKELGKIWFARVLDGTCQIIQSHDFDYELGKWYDVRLYVVETSFTLQIDGETVMSAKDAALSRGAFAFYTSKNAGAGFAELEIVRLKTLTNIDSFAAPQDKIITDFALMPAYPNPFSTRTHLMFYNHQGVDFQVKVYNILGQLVFNKAFVEAAVGWRQLQWDGIGEHGTPLPNGIYIVHIQAGQAKTMRQKSLSLYQKIILNR